MSEIRETLAILKARWPEVTLIIGLGVLSAVLSNRFRVVKSNLSMIGLLLYFGVSLSFMTVHTILNCGFLRTIYLQGKKQQSPIVLLKTGKYFFWRMVGFALFLMLAYIPLFGIILLVIKSLTSQYLLIYQLSITLPLLILIKPLLLMPALIIVLDCGVFKSWRLLKHCRFLNAKELVALFCLQITLTFLWILLRVPYDAKTISQYSLTIVPTAIVHFAYLTVAVMAVRFVASLDLLYDTPPVSPDFEDLRKYSNRNFKE